MTNDIEQMQISITIEFSPKKEDERNPSNIIGSTLDFRLSTGSDKHSFFNEGGSLTLLGATVTSKSLIHGLAGNMVGTSEVINVSEHLQFAGDELAKIITYLSGNYQEVDLGEMK